MALYGGAETSTSYVYLTWRVQPAPVVGTYSLHFSPSTPPRALPQSGLLSDPLPHRTHPTALAMPHCSGVPTSGGGATGPDVGAGGVGAGGTGVGGAGAGGPPGQTTSPQPSGSVLH